MTGYGQMRTLPQLRETRIRKTDNAPYVPSSCSGKRKKDKLRYAARQNLTSKFRTGEIGLLAREYSFSPSKARKSSGHPPNISPQWARAVRLFCALSCSAQLSSCLRHAFCIVLHRTTEDTSEGFRFDRGTGGPPWTTSKVFSYAASSR